MQGFQDIFISYGRRDSLAFAARLNRRLVDLGFTVWFDYDDIPLGVDYQKQIDDGIERSDNFVFVISPHSINSPYCGLELELALKHHKRIIPWLHVERISYDTWQERNPQGTPEEWADYQAKGLHDHFQNMHPILRKINWIYGREGQDDFEAAFGGLLEICDRHRDYVHQHTLILAKALEWERNQKRSFYLLIGEERLKAEEWLHIRFTDSQPPCLPTPLHCEFITESRKNAENLMTEVFIAYAEEERSIAEQIRQCLQREGFTVWTNTTDIQVGVAFQEAIDRGIEETNNVVYLLSPAAVSSPYCQHELEYAQSLQKRIIPVLVAAMLPEHIPLKLRDIQYIDLTDNPDESPLLKALRQDAAYHDTHKQLLTKALKWDRQNRNPTLLLRGYNLQQGSTWLKLAQQNTAYPALPLQETFIAESLRQPPGLSLDVFISYSRADSGFARRLNDALQFQGKRTWFDQESIAAGTADFQQEIHRGIETADIFLFILSPRSVTSPYCADEVEYAASLNKRFVTILHQPIDTAELHPELAKVQWLDFNRNDRDFSANFTALLRILDLDPEHLHAHTRLLMRAIEWDEKGRKESLLLRGDELTSGEQWLSQCEGKEPQPTELQQSYIANSRTVEDASHQAEQILKAAAAKGRLLVRLGAIAGSIGLSIAGVAGWFALQARTETNIAKVNLQVTSSQQEAIDQQPLRSLLKALEASKILRTQFRANSSKWRELQPSVIAILQETTDGIREKNSLEDHTDSVNSVKFSPDGMIIASGSDDKTIKLWNAQTGELIHTLKGHEGWITNITFSPNGKTIASSSADGTLKIWTVETGVEVHTFKGHQNQVSNLSFSPDGQMIASASGDKTINLWNLETGQIIHTLNGHQNWVGSIIFSPDGKTIASASGDKTIKLWNVETGQVVHTLNGHQEQVNEIIFGPDGKTIASASGDKTIKLWNVETGALIRTFNSHQDQVTDIRFSPDGKTIASASDDTTIKLWNSETGTLLHTLDGHTDRVIEIKFSPDGKMLISASFDNSIKLWTVETGTILYTLKGHRYAVRDVSFSPDGKIIASASQDRSIKLWDAETGAINHRTLAGHQDSIIDIRFSPDGKTIASGGRDQTIKIWNAQTGALLHNLQGHQGVTLDLSFSPDGKRIASSGTDKLIKLWDIETGTEIVTFPDDGAISLSFSPNEKTIASANWENRIKLWDVETGDAIFALEGHQDLVSDLRFSPDGKIIASASLDRIIKLWDAQTGTILHTLEGHNSGINGIGFSPDGKTIASSSDDYTIRLWDVKTGMFMHSLEGHQDRVNKISFSPDSTTIVSGSWDNTIKFWNIETQTILHSISVYPDVILDLQFSPDGKTIASGSWKGELKIWSWDLDHLTAIGCDWIQQYLITRPREQDLCLNSNHQLSP